MEEIRDVLPPAVIVTLIGVIVGLIIRATRLATRVETIESEMVDRVESEHALRKDLDAHITRSEVHFDQRLAREIEARQNDRFTRIEGDLHEIKDMVKEIARR